MADSAGDAFHRMGRGSGHAAKLNLGDALVYGHAAVTGFPLLFKGASTPSLTYDDHPHG